MPLIFHVFQVFRQNSGPTLCISHNLRFPLFLAIFQVLQCAIFIFHVFQCFSPYSRSCSVCVSLSTFFHVFPHIPGPTMIFSFSSFVSFPTYSRSYSVYFLFFTFFSVSRHVPGPTVCVPHCPRFFQFSHHTPDPTVCVSHFVRFSVFLTIFQVLQ